MGNCFSRKNNDLHASLINDSYELNENNKSQLFDNNIREVNQRIFSIEEKCGNLFKKFSEDINYLHQKILLLEKENNKLNKLDETNS